MATKNSDRYLIVGTGRTGSSLLSAILSNSGARFNLPVVTSWDRQSGEFEHPGLPRAYKWYWRSLNLPFLVPRKQALRAICRNRMNAALQSALTEAHFAKSSQLVFLVRPIQALGYKPRIIVSYRDFTGFSASRYLRFGLKAPEMARIYDEVYSTALLQLGIFGGCAVDYDELISRKEREWAKALSVVTGFDQSRLLGQRDALVRDPRARVENLCAQYPRTAQLYSALRRLKGRAVPAAAPPSEFL